MRKHQGHGASGASDKEDRNLELQVGRALCPSGLPHSFSAPHPQGLLRDSSNGGGAPGAAAKPDKPSYPRYTLDDDGMVRGAVLQP